MVEYIEGHSVEYSISGSGSLDPWSSEYASEVGVGIMCTADMANFILVDGDRIYRIKNGCGSIKVFESCKSLKTWGQFEEWLKENVERDFGSLAESKRSIDRMKIEHDEFMKLSEKEKKEYFQKKREERKLRREAEMKEKENAII